MDIKQEVLSFIKNHQNKLLIVFGILVLFSSSLILIFNNYKKEDVKEEIISYTEPITKEEPEQEEKIYVDIKGYIKNPGVYEMNANSRVKDVIKSSGGLKIGADTKYINLGKKVFDEMVIIIYSYDEILDFKEKNITEEKECFCEVEINDACVEESYSYFSNYSELSEMHMSNQLINLNTASLDELMTLNGIGESKAKLIIEYRKENKFNAIEDLMEVSGIGESVYSKIKDFITTE